MIFLWSCWLKYKRSCCWNCFKSSCTLKEKKKKTDFFLNFLSLPTSVPAKWYPTVTKQSTEKQCSLMWNGALCREKQAACISSSFSLTVRAQWWRSCVMVTFWERRFIGQHSRGSLSGRVEKEKQWLQKREGMIKKIRSDCSTHPKYLTEKYQVVAR